MLPSFVVRDWLGNPWFGFWPMILWVIEGLDPNLLSSIGVYNIRRGIKLFLYLFSALFSKKTFLKRLCIPNLINNLHQFSLIFLLWWFGYPRPIMATQAAEEICRYLESPLACTTQKPIFSEEGAMIQLCQRNSCPQGFWNFSSWWYRLQSRGLACCSFSPRKVHANNTQPTGWIIHVKGMFLVHLFWIPRPMYIILKKEANEKT